MKKILKHVSLMLAVALLLCGFSAVLAQADDGIDLTKLAQTQTDILVNADAQDIVATVDSEPIKRSSLDAYYAALEQTNNGFTKKDALDKMIQQQVMVQTAIDAGYTVSEEEITAQIEYDFAALDTAPDAKALMEEYADALGMSMEEYKQYVRPNYRDSILYNKWQAGVLEQFKARATLGTESVDFNDFLEEYKAQLFSEARVQILDTALQ